MPIHVLISERTFSGCEELAYDLQAHGRAVVVGRRSRGGAHPVEIFGLTDEIEAAPDVSRALAGADEQT